MLIKCLLCTRHCAGWYAYKTSFDGHIDLLRIFPCFRYGNVKTQKQFAQDIETPKWWGLGEIAAAAGSKLSTLPSPPWRSWLGAGPEYSLYSLLYY